MIITLFHVALGGAIGAVARHLSNVAGVRLFGTGFPVATLFVNILGCFLMGVIVVLLVQKGGLRFAPFLMTGILGGFTTFSAFALDTFTLYERGQVLVAAGYAAGSVVMSLGAVFAGVMVTRSVLA